MGPGSSFSMPSRNQRAQNGATPGEAQPYGVVWRHFEHVDFFKPRHAWLWAQVQVFRRLAEINVLKMARRRAKLNPMGPEWRHFEHVDFFKPRHAWLWAQVQ